MIDLYKQSDRQRSSLANYIPSHIAVVLAIFIFASSSGVNLIGTVGSVNDAEELPRTGIIPGEGLNSSIRVSEDLRLDTTALPTEKIFWQDLPDEQVIQNLVDAMTVEERISQLLLLGWRSEYAEGPIMDWISTRNLGGVKIFGWNGNNLQTLSNTLSQMQASALTDRHGIPLFTATDQEGGWVRHVKDSTSITPGNMAIGASALPLDSYLSGYYIGVELRQSA